MIEDYSKYFYSRKWRQRREEFLSKINGCSWCELPRKLVLLVYGKDLRVRERGKKPLELEALCPRCDEIETLGKTTLPEIQPSCICDHCKQEVWDFGERPYETLCARCTRLMDGIPPGPLLNKHLMVTNKGLQEGMEMWKYVLRQIVWMIDKDTIAKAFHFITQEYDLYPDSDDELITKLHELPSPEGYVKLLYGKGKKKSLLDEMPEPKGKPN